MQNVERESFVFHKCYYEALSELSEQERLKLYKYMFDYAFYNQMPIKDNEFPLPYAMFLIFKQTLDLARKKGAMKNGGEKNVCKKNYRQ